MSPTAVQETLISRPAPAVDELDEAIGFDDDVFGAAHASLQVHLRRSAIRVATLLCVDLVVITTTIALINAFGGGLLGDAVGRIVSSAVPAGTIFGPQLAVAIVCANLIVEGYRSGDRWRDPVRQLSAAGLGLVIALYSDLWHGAPWDVAGRALLTWVVLGTLLVWGRWLVHVASRPFLQDRMRHRVMEIRGRWADEVGPSLGPYFARVRSLPYEELPHDFDRMESLIVDGIDTVVVRGYVPDRAFGTITDFALTHGLRLLTIPRAAGDFGVESRMVWLHGQALSELTTPGLRASQLVAKRAFDLVFATALLVVLGPIMAIVAIAVRLSSPGPILFAQRRAAYRGGFFNCLKFRSMRVDAEEFLRCDPDLYSRYVENNFKLPEDEDPRITGIGRVLRRTSLDELPQLFNVVKGDMSLVGPRPVVEAELEMYRGRIPTFLSVKPGITGPWQIQGRSRVGFPLRARMDLDYVRNWSPLRDLWILVLTVPAVIMQRGAH